MLNLQVDKCLQKIGNDITDNMCPNQGRRRRSLSSDGLYVDNNVFGATGSDEPDLAPPYFDYEEAPEDGLFAVSIKNNNNNLVHYL